MYCVINDCSTRSLCCLCAGNALEDGGPRGCMTGAGHHLLPHLPDLELETDLAREDLTVFGLELCRGCVGGEEPLLLKELHHQLPPAVQRLPQRQSGGAGSLGGAHQAV